MCDKECPCDKKSKCSICGKKLCLDDQNQDHCKLEGHYFYDNEVYCINCWTLKDNKFIRRVKGEKNEKTDV